MYAAFNKYCRARLHELFGALRQVMIEDLGVAVEGGKLSQMLANHANGQTG